jgi:uncharacterized membrane protein
MNIKIFAQSIFFYSILSCSKNEDKGCNEILITLNTINPTPCTTQGSITVTFPIGANWQYSLNNNLFQSNTFFNNLDSKTYTVYAKNTSTNCIYTKSIFLQNNNASAGILFTAVKNLLANKCTPCHFGSNPQAGMDFSNSCIIVNNWDRIKARAIEANPTSMPPSGLLPLAERIIIIDWINAGHQYSN